MKIETVVGKGGASGWGNAVFPKGGDTGKKKITTGKKTTAPRTSGDRLVKEPEPPRKGGKRGKKNFLRTKRNSGRRSSKNSRGSY